MYVYTVVPDSLTVRLEVILRRRKSRAAGTEGPGASVSPGLSEYVRKFTVSTHATDFRLGAFLLKLRVKISSCVEDKTRLD
jgi:hypothetical protein